MAWANHWKCCYRPLPLMNIICPYSVYLQGTAGSQYFARRQCRVSSGTEVPENPAGGGARAWSSFQALPTQHPLSVHGAGLPGVGRGLLTFIEC